MKNDKTKYLYTTQSMIKVCENENGKRERLIKETIWFHHWCEMGNNWVNCKKTSLRNPIEV